MKRSGRCKAISLSDPAALQAVLTAAIDSGEPTVIDVGTDPEGYPPLSMFEKDLETLRSKPLKG